MAVTTYEAKVVNVHFTGEDGFTVMTTGNKSDGFEGAYQFTVDRTGDYLGMVVVKGTGKDRRFFAYDGVGDRVVGEYKTMLGIVKRLHTFAERRRKATIRTTAPVADAPVACDACGYDIEDDDMYAQSTEVNGEDISTCGGCADELGTLVLDAKEDKLNRESPRGRRPEYAELERELDAVAEQRAAERADVAPSEVAGPDSFGAVGEHCDHGMSVGMWCDRCEARVTPSTYHYQGCECRRCKARRADEVAAAERRRASLDAALDRIAADLKLAGPAISRMREAVANVGEKTAAPQLVERCEHGISVGGFCGLCGCTVSDDEQYVKAARRYVSYDEVNASRAAMALGLRAEYV